MTAKTAIWRRVFLIGFLPSWLTPAKLMTVPHAREKGAGAAQGRPGRLPVGAGSAPGLAPAALPSAGRRPVLAKHVGRERLTGDPGVGGRGAQARQGDRAGGQPGPAPGLERHQKAVDVG